MNGTTFKIEQLLESATKLGFTKHDFADLALVAAQRSGAAVTAQRSVARSLGIRLSAPHDQGTKRYHLQALARICQKLGGQLMLVPRQTLSDMFNRDWPEDKRIDLARMERRGGYSPAVGDDMDHGQNWRDKIIYAARGRESIGSIIHEMGHVFADLHPPDSSKCCEWKWFGWEMAVARRISAWETWSKYNDCYGVGGPFSWGDLSAKERQALIDERIQHAKKIGVLSATGIPRSLR